METWGRLDPLLDAVLGELAMLVGRKQIDRGLVPTNWLIKRRTQLSIQLIQLAFSVDLRLSLARQSSALNLGSPNPS